MVGNLEVMIPEPGISPFSSSKCMASVDKELLQSLTNPARNQNGRGVMKSDIRRSQTLGQYNGAATGIHAPHQLNLNITPISFPAALKLRL